MLLVLLIEILLSFGQSLFVDIEQWANLGDQVVFQSNNSVGIGRVLSDRKARQGVAGVIVIWILARLISKSTTDMLAASKNVFLQCLLVE